MPTQDPPPAVDDSLTLAEDCAKARERAKGFCVWTRVLSVSLEPLRPGPAKYRLGCRPAILAPEGLLDLGQYCPNCRKPIKFHESQAFDSPPGMETKSAPTASPEQSG